MEIFSNNREYIKEIQIRGAYMMIACDIEFLLLNILNYASPDPVNHARAGAFKKMQLAMKINNTIRDLKDHKPHHYDKYKTTFEVLEEFKEVRNHMAHCNGSFPYSPELSTFKVNYVDLDENGIERLMFIEYTDQYISSSIERFRKVAFDLTILMGILRNEFNSTENPLIHTGT